MQPEVELPDYIRTIGIFRALPHAQQMQVVAAMGEPEAVIKCRFWIETSGFCTKNVGFCIENVECLKYPCDRVVFFEGDPGNAFFLVESGNVDVTKGGIVLVTLGPKEYFGELAMIEGDGAFHCCFHCCFGLFL